MIRPAVDRRSRRVGTPHGYPSGRAGETFDHHGRTVRGGATLATIKGDPMDAIELLTSDHNEVRALFERFRTAQEQEDEATMGEVAKKVMLELEAHTTIEEEIFYPAITDADDEMEEDVAEAVQEHHVVDVLMNEMRELDAGSEEWVAKMTVLIENVEHHADEEEKEMFPEVRESLDSDRLAELGQQLLERKEALLSGAGSGGGGGSMTRDELYAKAKELGVEGRSTMTKDELARAVESAGS
jgi:hemerythrin superfamily protein